MTKISTKDWANLPIERWNITTFTKYLEHLTEEKFGVTYEPGSGGSKTQRWGREKGMMKDAQNAYGNAVLRRFIEICVEQYKPKQVWPYASFTFMYSYMSDRFPIAQSEIAEEERRVERAEERYDKYEESLEDFEDWL